MRAAVVPAAGGEAKLLPGLPDEAQSVRLSPDGRHIAYVTGEDGARRLYVAKADGSEAAPVDLTWDVGPFQWSPSGDMLAITAGMGTGMGIWIWRISDGKETMLHHGFCGAAFFSPDGRRLAYSVPLGKGLHSICVAEIATSKIQKLPVQLFDGGSISWSPDGRKLLYAFQRNVQEGIWVIDADGGEPKRLLAGGLKPVGPKYSPDGRRILFSGRGRADYAQCIYVCDSDGKNLRQLTRTAPSYWGPLWTPDGRRLALQTDSGHNPRFQLTEPGNWRRRDFCTMEEGIPAVASWARAGEPMMYVQSGKIRLAWASDLKKRRQVLSEFYPTWASLSADASEVYFAENRGDRYGISAVETSGKRKREITNSQTASPKDEAEPQDLKMTRAWRPVPGGGEEPERFDDLYPAASPGGRRIAFVRKTGIWLTDPKGESLWKLTEIAEEPGVKIRILQPQWSPNGRYIVFRTFRRSVEGTFLELHIADVIAGTSQRIFSRRVVSAFDAYNEELAGVPSFTADSSRVIFAAAPDGEPGIYSVKMNGSDLQRITRGPSSQPSISRGRWLAYTSLEGGRETIRVLDLDSGADRQIAP